MATDPYYGNVSLLLPMEGTNNSTLFPDFSPAQKSVTVYGNAKISTAQSKWGKGSCYFDGSGDYLAIANPSNLFTFLTGDFTIEGYFYGGARANRVLGTRNNGWLAVITPGTGISFNFWTTENQYNYLLGPSFPVNAWGHFAFCRFGNVYTAYTNGVGGTPLNTAARPGSSANSLSIGNDLTYPATDNTLGYLQDVRITAGVARYTANFTPPGRLVTITANDYPPLKAISGNCIKAGSGGANLVAIHDWTTRTLIATATPNVATGAWTASVPAGQYSITYTAVNCQPVCHGPYTVS